MRVELKYTEQTARWSFYYLRDKYGASTRMKYTAANFAKLAKIAIASEVAVQAKAELERLNAAPAQPETQAEE